jgi:DNA-binding LacI/PurR family transcriptional regulator
MPNVKMSDIAKAAGVSHATVARVIHKNGYVSEENRIKIEQLIADLGYVPNRMAQGLKSAQSKLIGHLMLFSPNMLFAKISYAVNQSAIRQGFHVLTLTSHKHMHEEESLINELIGQRVDGVIVTSNPFVPQELILKLASLNIPVVMIERTRDLPYVDQVRVDDHNGSFDAVRHMIDKGHRRIGYIGRLPTLPVNDVEIHRFHGYIDALKSDHLDIEDALIHQMDEYSVEDGYRATETLMNLDNPPTAIFATSDVFVCGELQYLYQCGKKVPGDVSLVGYDDTLSALMAPPITSVGLSHEKIGEQALQLLMCRMADTKAPAQSVMINTVFIDRQSVREIH